MRQQHLLYLSQGQRASINCKKLQALIHLLRSVVDPSVEKALYYCDENYITECNTLETKALPIAPPGGIVLDSTYRGLLIED